MNKVDETVNRVEETGNRKWCMDKKIRIAAYMRLSKADTASYRFTDSEMRQEERESNSIATQRLLIEHFVKEHFHDYELIEFQDDGYSGTNFNRPGIRAMLEAVKNAEVDCVIVKDFSRFARDYIELGAYIDQIFPFMGIRFISINDHYDSNECEGGIGSLDVSFRNLLYDLYSKDLSVKVKSALAVGKEKGQYVSAHCPFGYRKAPDNKHELLIDEKEAKIVRRIFEMAQKGMTSTQIAQTLNREKVKTPIEFRMERGEVRKAPKGKAFAWSGPGICQILRNETYAGAFVYGKYYKNEVGGQNHLKPRCEWKIVPDHHMPIINRESFEAVQKKHGTQEVRKREKKKKHPLAGKLICENCGRNLYLRGKANPYFCCAGLYDAPKEACVRKVNVMFLEQYLLYEMQQKGWGLAGKDRTRDGRELLYELLPELVEKIYVRDEQHMRICWKQAADEQQ